MSREDANFVIALTGLALALVATGAAIYAIRRDRPELRVTAIDAALANRYVTVVNVGLRPVRIERVLECRWTSVPALGTSVVLGAGVVTPGGGAGTLPAVVQPAEAVSLLYWPRDDGEFVRGYRAYLAVQDAAGRRYRVRDAPDLEEGAPGKRDWHRPNEDVVGDSRLSSRRTSGRMVALGSG
jgi:hypothetical protein